MRGLDTLCRYFEGLEDHYALIGGAACHLILGSAGLPFRATRDIDMVLGVEVVGKPLSRRLKSFLDDGGYRARSRGTRREFFRFHDPTDDRFPAMLEVFSRRDGTVIVPSTGDVARMPVEEGGISLSAILLDPDYHAAVEANRRVIEGIPVLDERLLIPFKARAHVDLEARRASGAFVRRADVNKHRNDVFRLLQLLPATAVVEVGPSIHADLERFARAIAADPAFDPAQFGVPLTRGDGIAMLRRVYRLD